MNKNERTRHLLRIAALGGMALVLVGCDEPMKDSLGGILIAGVGPSADDVGGGVQAG